MRAKEEEKAAQLEAKVRRKVEKLHQKYAGSANLGYGVIPRTQFTQHVIHEVCMYVCLCVVCVCRYVDVHMSVFRVCVRFLWCDTTLASQCINACMTAYIHAIDNTRTEIPCTRKYT